MERKFYKDLWSLRFKKMLKLEEQSIVDYEKLLAETKKRVQNEIISEHLKKLISDEKKHVLLVKELLQILERQPD